MSSHDVFLTRGAERDLDELHRHVGESDSRQRADQLLDQIQGACEKLATLPDRGPVPPELEDVGIREYRQIIVGPYRLIYRILDSAVYIYLIADGRRNMRAVLERRLLRP